MRADELNDIELEANRQSRKLLRMSQEMLKLVQAKLDKGETVRQAVSESWAEVGFQQRLTDQVLDAAVFAVSKGAIVAEAKLETLAFKHWYLHEFLTPEKLTISQQIWNTTTDIKKNLVQDITAAQKYQKSMFDAARDIQKSGATKDILAKDITALISDARHLNQDPDATAAFAKKLRAVQARINVYAENGVNQRLRVAYQDIINAVRSEGQQGLDRAVNWAVVEKGRANADRLLRTENARAYGVARDSAIAADEDALSWDWILNSEHVADNCDCEDNADNSPYPKGKGPAFPDHPNCLPGGNRIWFKGKLVGATKSFYSGFIIETRLASGKKFTVTPNHPILTSEGWVSAANLSKGQKVISCTDGKRPAFKIGFGIASSEPNNNQMPPRIKDIFTSLEKSPEVRSGFMPATSKDFHGDGERIKGDIHIINTKGLLLSDIIKRIPQHFCQVIFRRAYIVFLNFIGSRVSEFVFKRFLSSSKKIMSLFCHSLTKIFIHSMSKNNGISNPASLDTSFYKPERDSLSTDPQSVRDTLFALSGQIAFDEVVDIKNKFVHKNLPVYDLQIDPDEIYMCNGVIVKNCMCSMEPNYTDDKPDGHKEGEAEWVDHPAILPEQFL